ncbi:MAG: transglutaminase-like cysteine peptidase, partial [Deltaproteobacteria bacterium]|nr:transglutaminase-like cysteine peptidase [Deltaproteobacteria bacterium]
MLAAAEGRRPSARQIRSLLSLSCLLLLSFIPFMARTLTLERPQVGVDWSKMPQRPAAPSNVQYAPSRLFGTVEFRSVIKGMPQWERVLRMCAGKTGISEDLRSAGRHAEAQAWAGIKAENRNAAPLQKLQAVNKFINLWPYRTDMDVYGLIDYWATPAEFLAKSGDCEDYSISKMFALIELGFKPENLRVVALRDKIRNIDHAVLAAYVDDEVYILDNVSPLVLSHSKYGHYLPVY